MRSFSWCVTSTVSVSCIFLSVMPQHETSSGGVGPEVQEAIKKAFFDISANLSTVMKSKQADLK